MMLNVRELSKEEIIALALANGFKLKPQLDGTSALNPYVFDFVKACFEAARVKQQQFQD